MTDQTRDVFKPYDLASRRTIAELVAAYNEAMAQVDQAYKTLQLAKERLESVFGVHFQDFNPLPDRYSYGDVQKQVDEVKLKLKKNAWKCILEKLELHKILSTKRKEEFDKRLEDPKQMPAITESAVLDILIMLQGQTQDYAKEMVLECYDYLMRGQKVSNTYKTNAKNARAALGKKVILTGIVEHGYSGGCPIKVVYGNYGENHLILMDKVFFALDGKGVPTGYRSPLVDTINSTKDQAGETDYFKYIGYPGTRTLHITFKRMDLVARMNKIAGNSERIAD